MIVSVNNEIARVDHSSSTLQTTNICVDTVAYMYEICKIVPFSWHFMDGPSVLRWLLMFIRAGEGGGQEVRTVSLSEQRAGVYAQCARGT